MWFNGIAAVMLLVAAAGIFLALRYGARKRPSHLMDTAEEELVRLAQDREAGLIDAEAYEAAKRDVETHRHAGPESGEAGSRGSGHLFGVVAALVPVLGALLLYTALGRPELADMNTRADSVQAEGERPDNPRKMVQRLADRMERNPDDLRGWKMLGRSYVVLGEYGNAREAYARAVELDDGSDPRLQVAYAEAMVLDDVSTLDGRAGRIFEETLATEPDNPRALWYGGLAAAREGRTDLATERWQRLLEQNPPERLRKVVEERLAALGAEPPPESGSATTGKGVTVRVKLAPDNDFDLNANTPVFVFVRPEGANGGPPLAVKRLRVGDLPATVRLVDADAMVQGNAISGHERVRVVARVARSGGVQAKTGDIQGSARATVSESVEPVPVTIDRVLP